MVRGITELSGLREIRTMTSSKKRSIPRVQSSAYLDLYMLKKEKDRIEKEIYILEKRKDSTQKRLAGIDAEMKKIEQKEVCERPMNDAETKAVAPGKNPAKEWKTMAIKY
jgi:predicted  nucleic acid-binding Zn-ribbon protein